jgi:integrase
MKLSLAATPFTAWIQAIQLAKKTEKYYQNGVRLLSDTILYDVELTDLSAHKIATIHFPGSSSNANNALRTLRRLLSWAKDEGLIKEIPHVKMLKERRRELMIGALEEAKILACGFQPLNDVLIIMREMGMRNESEVLKMRWENIRWEAKSVFVPEGKTEASRREVPMTDRVIELLKSRKQETGWVFPSRSGHIRRVNQQFRNARKIAGLPREMVLYCARHDFGTYALEKTGNLAAVMKVMGHTQVQTAMRYQHPKIDLVRDVMNLRKIA